MNIDKGRPDISPRVVLGALIVKHKEKLDDRGVRNSRKPLYAFFCGFKRFFNKTGVPI